jgi:hypothetical protein
VPNIYRVRNSSGAYWNGCKYAPVFNQKGKIFKQVMAVMSELMLMKPELIGDDWEIIEQEIKYDDVNTFGTDDAAKICRVYSYFAKQFSHDRIANEWRKMYMDPTNKYEHAFILNRKDGGYSDFNEALSSFKKNTYKRASGGKSLLVAFADQNDALRFKLIVQNAANILLFFNIKTFDVPA